MLKSNQPITVVSVKVGNTYPRWAEPLAERCEAYSCKAGNGIIETKQVLQTTSKKKNTRELSLHSQAHGYHHEILILPVYRWFQSTIEYEHQLLKSAPGRETNISIKRHVT